MTTTSHSRRTPRATASTGSNVRERSTQATTEPAAWASATVRSASVVRPLDPSPRRATPAFRGRPPGPRIASSSAKPVETTRSSGARAGPASPSGAAAGTSASAPSVSRRGAAAPQRASRLARAADTSAGRSDTRPVSNKCSTSSTVSVHFGAVFLGRLSTGILGLQTPPEAALLTLADLCGIDALTAPLETPRIDFRVAR